jgi:hypothetical protein
MVKALFSTAPKRSIAQQLTTALLFGRALSPRRNDRTQSSAR